MKDRTKRYRDAVLAGTLDDFYRTKEYGPKTPYLKKAVRQKQRFEDKRFPPFRPRKVA
jgi:hypothetical protein